MIKSGRKLAAIKHIRQTFGVTLREAKRLADELDDNVNEYEDEAITRAKNTGKNNWLYRWWMFRGDFRLNWARNDYWSNKCYSLQSTVSKQREN